MNITGIGQVIAVLNDLQTKKIINEFAIGGAVAAVLHNEPISTIDLDIFFFLAEKDNSPILSLDAIYNYAKENSFAFDAEFINIHGWLVQFVEASHNQLWIEAIENADEITIDNFNVLVIGREHLVAMWLLAGRKKDYQKISMFIEADFLDNEKLFDILERYNLLAKWQKEQWRFLDE
jgi:predicted nucleotidyltransferase